MNRRKIKESLSYRIFKVVNTAFLLLLAALCIMPFLHVIAKSLSDAASNAAGTIGLLPKGFQLAAYRKIFSDSAVFQAFGITLLRMALGTVWSMFLTISAAYPLSMNKREFFGRQFFVVIFFISMLFSGGIIPYYMLMKELNLLNTIWVLVVGTLPVGNAIILMNFFRTLPHEIYESAAIDGASHFKILTRIYLPLSKPSIATLSLFSLVAHWNDWFGGLIYMQSPEKYPLQTYIYNVSTVATSFVDSLVSETAAPRQAVNASLIVFSMLPILIVFPLLMRHVKDGMVIGAVKG